MKKVPNPLEVLIQNNPDLKKMVIESYKDQKGQKFTNATVSLPQVVISMIEKMNVENDIPTKRIMQNQVKMFTYMERTFEESRENFGEFLLDMKDDLLKDVFDPSDLIIKSYQIDKRVAIQLKLLAQTGSMSRNELISLGVIMIASQYQQYEEVYGTQVTKYQGKFERLLDEIQSIKREAIEELNNNNDQIVLMAGRLESHIRMQLAHYEKYQEEGIWYLGSKDSENIEYIDLIKDLFRIES